MGQLSTATIISKALNKAGDTRLTTDALTWLNAWLRSTYAAWPWPFLQRRATAIPLVTGAQSISFGVGSGGVTGEVKRVLDPVWVYNAAFTTRQRARIRTLISGDFFEDETINNPATNRGLPAQFKVRADAAVWGKWSLIPTPVPDKDYLMAVDYIAIPADIVTTSDVPIYPNDRTLMQAVLTDALFHMNNERHSEELEILASMTIQDRVKYGEVAGTNDQLGLDPAVFK